LALTTLKQINHYAQAIYQNSDKIKQTIAGQKAYLTDLLNKFNKLDTSIIQDWIKYVSLYF